MDKQALYRHALVLLATAAGILGMGMIFTGTEHGSIQEISRGVPLLLIGLWWAGRELSKSILGSRQRRAAQASRKTTGLHAPRQR